MSHGVLRSSHLQPYSHLRGGTLGARTIARALSALVALPFAPLIGTFGGFSFLSRHRIVIASAHRLHLQRPTSLPIASSIFQGNKAHVQ